MLHRRACGDLSCSAPLRGPVPMQNGQGLALLCGGTAVPIGVSASSIAARARLMQAVWHTLAIHAAVMQDPAAHQP